MNQFSIPLPHVEEVEVLLEELIDQEALDLVVFNDDVNTFDYVIDTLIDVCKHTAEQAEQCSLIVHYKGKCTVKTGPLDELKIQCNRLNATGLTAELT